MKKIEILISIYHFEKLPIYYLKREKNGGLLISIIQFCQVVHICVPMCTKKKVYTKFRKCVHCTHN